MSSSYFSEVGFVALSQFHCVRVCVFCVLFLYCMYVVLLEYSGVDLMGLGPCLP